MGEVGINNVRMNTFTQDILTRGIWSEGVVNRNNITENQVAIRDPVSGALLKGTFSSDGKTFIGDLTAGNYQGHHAMWTRNGNNWRLVEGTATATTSAALEKITGGQLSGLRAAQVTMRNGQVAFARGIDENTGAQVTVRKGEDGKMWMTYEKGGAKVEMVSGDGGQSWIPVKMEGGISVNLAQKYAENLSKRIQTAHKVSEAFRKEKGLQNADTNTIAAGFSYTHDIAVGKGEATQNERSFAKDVIRYAGIKAIESLGKTGEVRREGQIIDQKEAQRKIDMGIGIRIAPQDSILKLFKFIQPYFGVSASAAYITRDGWVIKDTKGQWWYFKRDEQEEKAMREAFKSVVGGENRDFIDFVRRVSDREYTDSKFQRDLQDFKRAVGTYSAQVEKDLRKEKDYVLSHSRDINMQAGHIFLKKIADDLFGGDMKQAVEWYLNMLGNSGSVDQRIRSLESQVNGLKVLMENGNLSEEERKEYSKKLKQLNAELDYLYAINEKGRSSPNVLISIVDEVMERITGGRKEKLETPDVNPEQQG